MDWLCDNYGTIKEKRYPQIMNPVKTNIMLEQLFDKDVWMVVNDIIGALAQYDNIDKNMIDEALRNLTRVHIDVIDRFRFGKKEMQHNLLQQ